MNDDELKKIKEEIDGMLKESGVQPNKMDELRGKIMKYQEKKNRELIASEVVRQILNPVKTEDIIKAIREIKIEPIVNVSPTDVKFSIPEPRVIMQEPPKISVNPPQVIVQEREFPKEFSIIGFAGFIKNILEAIKGVFSVQVSDNTPKNPLYVTLAYANKAYKGAEETALGAVKGGILAGGGPSSVYLKGSNHKEIKPLSEAHDTIESGNVTVVTAGTAVQLSSTPTSCRKVIVHAVNGHIVVGGSDVEYAEATRKGVWISMTGRETFYPSDLDKIYVDAENDNTLVSFTYEN